MHPVQSSRGGVRMLNCRVMRWTACILIAAALAGCQRLPEVQGVGVTNDWQRLEGQPGPGLVASQSPPIADVAMPIGFKPLPDRCTSSTDGQVRSIHHVYQGISSVGDTVGFYRQQLAHHGWEQLRLNTSEAPDVTLHAVKGAEAVAVAIRKKNNVTTLTVTVGPR